MPYGSYAPAIYLKEVKAKEKGDSEQDKQPIPPQYEGFFGKKCTPEPVSRDMQQTKDEEEEKANKEKERDARQAQKELEQRKARQKAEAQQ